MKKLTTILLTLLCFVSTQSYGHTGTTPIRPTKATLPPQSVYLTPPKYLAPLSPLTLDSLYYTDLASNQLRYELVPGTITFNLDATTKFLDTIMGYAERFTAPYIAYLDSIQFDFVIFNAVKFPGNRLFVTVNGQTLSNGIPYSGNLIDSASIYGIDDETLYPTLTPLTQTVTFKHKRVGKDFFVSLFTAYDFTNENTTDFQNRIGILGDSLDYPDGTVFDKNIHRGYMEGLHYQAGYRGITLSDQSGNAGSPFYTNFSVKAFVSSIANSVEETKTKSNALAQNFPNPFNPSTEIRYSTSERVYATLKVYNALGREVKTLVDGYVDGGEHTANFAADNLPSGTYYYTLKAGNFTQTKRMILAK